MNDDLPTFSGPDAVVPDRSPAEPWECSDVVGHRSVVANGPLAGVSLHQALSGHPEALMAAGFLRCALPSADQVHDAAGTLPCAASGPG
ncbi:hypothetical protein GTY54_07770 [Streptomyces sp. SID625]|nr:hypothetical protein [Streptomyces sp. SID625]